MWNRLYRNHVIMPFPSHDTATNAWAPQADISWCAGSSRESEFVKFPNRFITEAEAVVCALRSGEAWIDNRLGRSAAEKTLTFGQFKSVIAKSGVTLSEQTLHKSYAALVKLRKNRHCSWTQLREKVEHSQRDRTTAESPARQQKIGLIPLTERDWRRIVIKRSI
jgi:hypothetical protein